jgi:diketogulonate reductase-like aldo/keto reductase
MEDSMRRMGTRRMDLMQIHNLVDWRTHLKTLRGWKEQGRIRYLGITHYQLSAFAELESIMRNEDVDFIQLPYSLGVREAEKRLLPVAAEKQVAVLVMRPLEGGGLFSRVRNKPLPAWAAELDCTTWAQVFLKFILAHPAVTAPIPATAKATHMAENMAALMGRLPDEKMRQRMIAAVEG